MAKKVAPMTKWAKRFTVLIVFALMAYLPAIRPASAISADLAKKCRAMAIKAHPSPKIGSKASGAEKAQRDYFRDCVSKGAKMEN